MNYFYIIIEMGDSLTVTKTDYFEKHCETYHIGLLLIAMLVV